MLYYRRGSAAPRSAPGRAFRRPLTLLGRHTYRNRKNPPHRLHGTADGGAADLASVQRSPPRLRLVLQNHWAAVVCISAVGVASPSALKAANTYIWSHLRTSSAHHTKTASLGPATTTATWEACRVRSTLWHDALLHAALPLPPPTAAAAASAAQKRGNLAMWHARMHAQPPARATACASATWQPGEVWAGLHACAGLWRLTWPSSSSMVPFARPPRPPHRGPDRPTDRRNGGRHGVNGVSLGRRAAGGTVG